MFNKIIKKLKKRKTLKKDDKSPILRIEHALSADGDGETGDVVFMNPHAQNILNAQQALSTNGSLEKVLGHCPEVIPGQSEMTVDSIIEAFAVKHFSKVPKEGDLQLSIHLKDVQDAIICDLLKLVTLPKEVWFLESRIECYHQRIFKHLNQILLHIRTTEQAFTLLDWVVHSYSSQEFKGHPNLKDEALQKQDLMLLSNYLTHATEKVLPIIQEEISTSLTRILQNEECSRDIESYSGNEEAFVALYVDAIQCIDAVRKTALKISSNFKTKVEEVCFHELHNFIKMYTSAEKKYHQKQTQTDKTILHSFKTFNHCVELRQYVQTTGKNINKRLYTEIISALESMEASALKVILRTLMHRTEISFKTYFKKGGHMENITTDIKELLDPIPNNWKTQEFYLLFQTVVNKAYESILTLYLKCLVQSNRAHVMKAWPDVGKRVTQDAQLLDDMFQGLNPKVERKNLILRNVGEILECSSIDTVKLITANTLKECPIASVDLIKALLRWRGISGKQL
ncbi:exocyst complex component 3 isoform X2 [Hypomesus transpacificus]|uniref:exocyst complex component 3 isoform X2 n=1 Tax=Hypomesus transpacificus TaxID=137520 RepID=UPI001F085BFB|nr:exocyst complex component 3 isoform X2 [Hypomesus transpacificus]